MRGPQALAGRGKALKFWLYYAVALAAVLWALLYTLTLDVYS